MASRSKNMYSPDWPYYIMKKWISEVQTENLELRFAISEILHAEKSKLQELVIVDTIEYGRMLLLDGAVQTAVGDEFIYHEMITHVPLCAYPDPKRVVVIGGGDGGTIREILKHDSVESAVLVEIDEAVVRLSRRYLPEISHSLDDERVNLIIDDGIEYIRNSQDEFDVVIVDSTDPVGPAEGLFSKDFYASLYSALKDDGIFVAQTGSPFSQGDIVRSAFSLISKQFPWTRTYLAAIPTYPSGLWSFTAGSKCGDIQQLFNEKRTIEIRTKYYSPDLHRAAFVLPEFIKELIR